MFKSIDASFAFNISGFAARRAFWARALDVGDGGRGGGNML